MKIGVFDSGIGGLSVLRQFLKNLPEYDYVYFGDNKNEPYGDLPPERIYDLCKQAAEFLFQNDCKLVIFACNTATSVSLRKLQQTFLPSYFPDRHILGVIRPAIESLIDSNSKKAGLIATTATVSSNAFLHELKKLSSGIILIQEATPLLVPQILKGEINSLETEQLVESYLAPLKKEHIDSLILGCTHYELIQHLFEKHVGPQIQLISEGQITAIKLKDYLFRHPEIEHDLSKTKTINYYVSDVNDHYRYLLNLFLNGYIQSEATLQLAQI